MKDAQTIITRRQFSMHTYTYCRLFKKSTRDTKFNIILQTLLTILQADQKNKKKTTIQKVKKSVLCISHEHTEMP